MKAPRFSYARPDTLEEVLSHLGEHGDGAAVLAGGQSLMPTLNMRLSQPDIVVDINQLDTLRGIELADGTVRIGALTRHVEVLDSVVVAEHLPLIAEAMPHVAHVAVRNRGTFGGSVALADPAAELPACVLALGATIVVQSTQGQREIPADAYFLGLYDTARKPGELLTEIRIPVESSERSSVFMELSQRQGDFAMAGIAATVQASSERILDARLVYFASEDRPTVGEQAMASLRGKPWDADSREAVQAALAQDLDPIPNLHGSAEMKLHLQRVLTVRSLDRAMQRAAA